MNGCIAGDDEQSLMVVHGFTIINLDLALSCSTEKGRGCSTSCMMHVTDKIFQRDFCRVVHQSFLKALAFLTVRPLQLISCQLRMQAWLFTLGLGSTTLHGRARPYIHGLRPAQVELVRFCSLRSRAGRFGGLRVLQREPPRLGSG